MSTTERRWWDRLQQAINAELKKPGYYKWPMADRNVLKLPPAERWRMGKTASGKYSTGTCGHHATWLVVGLVADPAARIGATGMNLTSSWAQRSKVWESLTPRSSCAVALLNGEAPCKDKSGRIYTCKGYASLFVRYACERMRDVPDVLHGKNGIAVIETPHHVEVALNIPLEAHIKHPVTGETMAGCWQFSADGSSANPGQPHTLRQWAWNEPGSTLHCWFLPAGSVVEAVDWSLIIED